jgi:hypothetical protein
VNQLKSVDLRRFFSRAQSSVAPIACVLAASTAPGCYRFWEKDEEPKSPSAAKPVKASVSPKLLPAPTPTGTPVGDGIPMQGVFGVVKVSGNCPETIAVRDAGHRIENGQLSWIRTLELSAWVTDLKTEMIREDSWGTWKIQGKLMPAYLSCVGRAIPRDPGLVFKDGLISATVYYQPSFEGGDIKLFQSAPAGEDGLPLPAPSPTTRASTKVVELKVNRVSGSCPEAVSYTNDFLYNDDIQVDRYTLSLSWVGFAQTMQDYDSSPSQEDGREVRFKGKALERYKDCVAKAELDAPYAQFESVLYSVVFSNGVVEILTGQGSARAWVEGEKVHVVHDRERPCSN